MEEQSLAITLSNSVRSRANERTGKGGGRSYAAYIYRAGTSNDDANRVWKEKETAIIDNIVPELMESCVDIIGSDMEV